MPTQRCNSCANCLAVWRGGERRLLPCQGQSGGVGTVALGVASTNHRAAQATPQPASEPIAAAREDGAVSVQHASATVAGGSSADAVMRRFGVLPEAKSYFGRVWSARSLQNKAGSSFREFLSCAKTVLRAVGIAFSVPSVAALSDWTKVVYEAASSLIPRLKSATHHDPQVALQQPAFRALLETYKHNRVRGSSVREQADVLTALTVQFSRKEVNARITLDHGDDCEKLLVTDKVWKRACEQMKVSGAGGKPLPMANPPVRTRLEIESIRDYIRFWQAHSVFIGYGPSRSFLLDAFNEQQIELPNVRRLISLTAGWKLYSSGAGTRKIGRKLFFEVGNFISKSVGELREAQDKYVVENGEFVQARFEDELGCFEELAPGTFAKFGEKPLSFPLPSFLQTSHLARSPLYAPFPSKVSLFVKRCVPPTSVSGQRFPTSERTAIPQVSVVRITSTLSSHRLRIHRCLSPTTHVTTPDSARTACESTCWKPTCKLFSTPHVTRLRSAQVSTAMKKRAGLLKSMTKSSPS